MGRLRNSIRSTYTIPPLKLGPLPVAHCVCIYSSRLVFGHRKDKITEVRSKQLGQLDTEQYKNWMQLALELAKKSGEDVPVGALVIKDNRIIGRGCNQRELCNDPSAHAEIVALREAAQTIGSWRMQEATVICTLEPCPMCAEAILQSRVSKLVFGARDLVYGATGSAFNLYCEGRTFPLPEVISGILEDDCRRLLTEYFRQQRAKKDWNKP